LLEEGRGEGPLHWKEGGERWSWGSSALVDGFKSDEMVGEVKI